MQYLFGDYVLDTQCQELQRAGAPVPLRRKVFQVLVYLLAHHERVVPKQELLERLWPDQFIGDEALLSCIRTLRRALGERGRAPRVLRTLHGQGYRVVAPVEVRDPRTRDMPAPHVGPPPAAAPPGLAPVGREAALRRLHAWLARARSGVRQVVLVTGAAGLGKTTLVEAFVAQLGAEGPLWLGRGQCVEHYGAGEPYLPVLEALGRLCRGPEGPEVVALLAQQAPTWLVQMPGLVPPTDLEAVQRRLAGATRERMLRELAEALELLTARQSLLLVLEDLHWSDASTLDLLAVLARRREPARLLLLGTYRPPDALQRGQPLATVHHELQRHGHCAELPLPLLSEAAVAAYLARRFPEAPLPAGLARLVQQRTEGQPLFMVTVVEEWVRRGWLVPADGGWTLRVALAALASTVPEDLRQMLEHQVERLSPTDQRVLEVGSVAGATFAAAAVAAGLGQEVVAVEDWCAGLARRQQWLEACGEEVWPDGTVAERYRFRHALYQEVAYQRLPAARRAQLHRRIGEREEAGYGLQVRERAAELAMHFVRGRDYQRAVRYLWYAGGKARQRLAFVEAIAYLTQGLELLETLPDTPERTRQELDFLAALARALQVTKGGGTPELEPVLTRASALSQQVGEPRQRVAVLNTLYTFRFIRAEPQAAQLVAEQLLDLAQCQLDPALLLRAHWALGQILWYLGAFAPARIHFEQAIALDDSQRHATPQTAIVGMPNNGVDCRIIVAVVLWALGYLDQAVQRSQEALTIAHALKHPYGLGFTLFQSARFYCYRREWQTAQAHAEAALALATERGFVLYAAVGAFFRGLALAAQGQEAEGIAQMRQGLAAIQATGTAVDMPFYLTQLAAAHGQVGQVEEGLSLLMKAMAVVDTTGGRYHAAELHRLHGELLLRQAVPDAPQAEACFQQALAIARCQQAKSWELRAAMSLARLWQHQSKRAEARKLLAAVYGWFTEGFDTADLQDARALLDALR
jgi:DNA-binding winged helix-turn-helix (wHTH) protein/tetratricopeptide (TPR) repeat protein